MPTKVIMPQLGESVVEGTVSKWLKGEGDQVNEYDPLLEINTDKVDTEIPSPASGVLLKILASEGETVQVGAPLAWIGEPGEPVGEGNGAVEEKTIPVPAGQPTEEPPGETSSEPVAAYQPVTPVPEALPPTPGRDRDLGFISPVVARIASEHKVDLTQVRGTGQSGRITKKDVLAYVDQLAKRSPAAAKAAEKPAPSAPATPVETLPGQVLPLTAVRRAIADHMVYSKHTSPHVTTVMEADLNQVVAHRAAYKEGFSRDGINLTYTAYFVSAIVIALKAYPIVNSSWSEEGIVLHREINPGMAVSLGEGGLIVPVIKNADSYSLLGLARAINDLADRARSRQLRPEEVKGGTFTLTNHGTSGSLFATPIINQPQCGILGVGAVQKRVVVINDAIAIRPMVYVSLTFDHRILDGAIGDQFLAKVVETLENWS
jgi:2-oxoglutarate dehydrogenase dihydrolipoamide succinyltransferase (E2 component)